MSDHIHICAVCGHQWDCVSYKYSECYSKGVFKAAQVNRAGPYCWVCYYLTMAFRHWDLRNPGPLVMLLDKVIDYEAHHYDSNVHHPLEGNESKTDCDRKGPRDKRKHAKKKS